MRIVFIHTDFRIYWPPRLKFLHEHLQAQGHELRVIEISGKGSPYAFAGSLDHDSSWWECLFPDMGMEQVKPVDACRAIFAKLDAIRPDIIFSGSIAFASGASAVVWARHNHTPIVIFDNARLCDVPRNGMINAVKRRFFANSDAVLIPAPSHASDYRFWGYTDEQIFYGLNVVDNDFWSGANGQSSHDLTRTDLQLPQNYFLGVGRQVEKKNWMQLLRAYRQYRDEVADARAWGLVLVGNGPERPAIESFIRSARMPGVVLIDFLPPPRLAAVYAGASFLVLPSLYGETWGLVVNEAMCCGLPVLVSERCGCASTLVEVGRNGWVFDPEDLQQLKECLTLAASRDDDERARMGAASREIIGQWSLDRFCAGVDGAIRFCQNKKSGFKTGLDRLLLPLWKGRYRPT